WVLHASNRLREQRATHQYKSKRGIQNAFSSLYMLPSGFDRPTPRRKSMAQTFEPCSYLKMDLLSKYSVFLTMRICIYTIFHRFANRLETLQNFSSASNLTPVVIPSACDKSTCDNWANFLLGLSSGRGPCSPRHRPVAPAQLTGV
ncbi:unnamed protein product, partial [Ectocarpus sp. 12 AP-2014]